MCLTTSVYGNCVGVVRIVRPHLEFVYRFLYQLSLLEGHLYSPAENAIAYVTSGCSVLAGEYESLIASVRFRS